MPEGRGGGAQRDGAQLNWGAEAGGQRVAQEQQLTALQSARHFADQQYQWGSDVDMFAADSGSVGLLALQGLEKDGS